MALELDESAAVALLSDEVANSGTVELQGFATLGSQLDEFVVNTPDLELAVSGISICSETWLSVDGSTTIEVCTKETVDSGKRIVVVRLVVCPVELIAVPFRVVLKCHGDNAKLDATVAEPKTQPMNKFDVIIVD